MTADEPKTESKNAVASVAGHLSVLLPREHALLRRMFLTQKPAADGVVIKLLLHAGVQPRDYEPNYGAWRALVHIAALLSGTSKTNPHDPRRGFGTALREAGVSENRFLRLTAARAGALQDQTVLAGRMLAKKAGGAFDLWTVLHLIGSDPAEAEQARLRMARDYYTADVRAEGNAK